MSQFQLGQVKGNFCTKPLNLQQEILCAQQCIVSTYILTPGDIVRTTLWETHHILCTTLGLLLGTGGSLTIVHFYSLFIIYTSKKIKRHSNFSHCFKLLAYIYNIYLSVCERSSLKAYPTQLGNYDKALYKGIFAYLSNMVYLADCRSSAAKMGFCYVINSL